jgi:hypothetical protein
MNILDQPQLMVMYIVYKPNINDIIFICIFTIFLILSIIYYIFRWSNIKKQGKIVKQDEKHILVYGISAYIITVIFYLIYKNI